MDTPPIHQVTAADFVRHLARHRESATISPVFITNHSRPTHVLTSIQFFDQMSEGGGGNEAPADILAELGQWMNDAIVICDRQMIVMHVNRVAEAIARRPARDLVGHSALDLPGIRGTHLAALLSRVGNASDPIMIDIASPFAEDSWLRLRAFPWRDYNVIGFRDVTERVMAQRLAATKAAILSAMGIHEGVGYIRVSVRGLIERADKPFADMLGVPEERLNGVPLIDVIATSDRVEFRTALDATIRAGTPHRMTTRFVCNGGGIQSCCLSMVQLDGPYSIEGAVLIFTPSDDSLAASHAA